MTISIVQIRDPKLREIAEKVDTENNKDGQLTGDEVSLFFEQVNKLVYENTASRNELLDKMESIREEIEYDKKMNKEMDEYEKSAEQPSNSIEKFFKRLKKFPIFGALAGAAFGADAAIKAGKGKKGTLLYGVIGAFAGAIASDWAMVRFTGTK